MALKKSIQIHLSLAAVLLLSFHSVKSFSLDSAPQPVSQVSERSNAKNTPLVFDKLQETSNQQKEEPVNQIPKLEPPHLDFNKKLDWDAFRLQALDTSKIKIGSANSKSVADASDMFGVESVPATETTSVAAPLPATNGTAAGAANGTSLTIAQIPFAVAPLASKDILSQFF